MVEDLTPIIAAIGVLCSVLATVIVGNHMRKKGREDTIDGHNAAERVRQKGGKVVETTDNKIGSRHELSHSTDAHIVDNRNQEPKEN